MWDCKMNEGDVSLQPGGNRDGSKSGDCGQLECEERHWRKNDGKCSRREYAKGDGVCMG